MPAWELQRNGNSIIKVTGTSNENNDVKFATILQLVMPEDVKISNTLLQQPM